MYKVASQAGVIHSQNQGFHARSRPARDAQELSSPFSQLLDDASGAPPLLSKDVCDRPQTSQAPATNDPQQQPPQAPPAGSEPAQQPALATPAQPVDKAEIEKTVAEANSAASPVDQTDPAKASGDAAATMVIALANVAQSMPEQQIPAVVIAPVTPFETQPSPEQTAEPSITAPATLSEPQPDAGNSVTAPTTPLETQPVSGQAVSVGNAPVSSSEAQSAPPQPVTAAMATASEIEPAHEQPNSAFADATAITAQTQPAATGTAQPAGLDDAAMTSAASLQPAPPPKVTEDQKNKIAAANPNGSPIESSQIDGPPTADVMQTSNPAPTTNGAPATNAGPAAGEEHRNGHADSAPEGKKEHAAVTPADSRIGLQNSESLSTPHAGDVTQAGKTPDGAQLLNLQHPADRFATVESPAAQSASAQDAAAAAVPLAGLAVEIAARAQAGRNRFEIRLDPPELGRIDVRLDIDRSGQVTSRLTVERVETLDALRRDAGDLERALQQAGLKTADNGLQFTLRDQSFAGRDQDLPTTAAARVVAPAPELAAIDATPAGYGRIPRPGGGIDIRV